MLALAEESRRGGGNERTLNKRNTGNLTSVIVTTCATIAKSKTLGEQNDEPDFEGKNEGANTGNTDPQHHDKQ